MCTCGDRLSRVAESHDAKRDERGVKGRSEEAGGLRSPGRPPALLAWGAWRSPVRSAHAPDARYHHQLRGFLTGAAMTAAALSPSSLLIAESVLVKGGAV